MCVGTYRGVLLIHAQDSWTALQMESPELMCQSRLFSVSENLKSKHS